VLTTTVIEIKAVHHSKTLKRGREMRIMKVGDEKRKTRHE
jgi:hypothetical protein